MNKYENLPPEIKQHFGTGCNSENGISLVLPLDGSDLKSIKSLDSWLHEQDWYPQILADIIWLGFLALMIVQTLIYTKLLFDVSYVLPGLKIELRWLQMFIPMIFCLMLYRVFEVYWEWKKTGWKGLPL